MSGNREWTLRAMATTHTAVQIGAVLRRTRHAVKHAASHFGIRMHGSRKCARYSEATVKAVRDMAARGVPLSAIESGTGISHAQVWRIVNREQRACP